MPDSLQPHGQQHARLPCPSLSAGVCSNSCSLSWWCHPTISFSVAPFSSCPQSFPASGSFLISLLFASGGQSIGALCLVSPSKYVALLSGRLKKAHIRISKGLKWRYYFHHWKPSEQPCRKRGKPEKTEPYSNCNSASTQHTWLD